ncbi:MAG: molybdenum cofactor biosynthesis protein MoaE [Thaumarchaeota archaeon]|nr:molybdenum cofactor biosynthesis protein MoaE [Nitrososphaerota archaeon]
MKKGILGISSGVFPKRKLNFGKIYSSFLDELSNNTGSVTSFLGVARLESADGKKKIRSLIIESYEKHADNVLNKIASDTKKKYGLTNILIVHGVGRFSPGEPVVMVLVASSRRSEGFSALREAVERYKKEPALFKKEVYSEGTSAWIT